MKLRRQVLLVALFIVAFAALLAYLSHGVDVPVLQTKGVIAEKERNLILFTVALGLFVVIPVFVMLFVIAWRYREGNTKAKYAPNWDRSQLLEAIWWGVPCLIILVLGVVTWRSTHALDPYKPIASSVTPVKIQVISLQWKWLFIYPDQKIATVNMIQLPEKTPINFELTSDAPMNSFWIPSLGGQVYAMSGMSTRLHLMANETGVYNGVSANISGQGFAGMKFVANVTSKDNFDAWVSSAQASAKRLDATEYGSLAQPSKDVPQAVYVLKQADLYDTIVNKYSAMDMSNEGTH